MLNSTLNRTNDKLLYVSTFNKLLYFTRECLRDDIRESFSG